MTSSVIIGIGNPVISDDALGIEVARSVRAQLTEQSGVTVTEVYNGGLELMEAMAGYDCAFLIDSIVTGEQPGTIHRLGLDDVAKTRNSSTTHNGSLAIALELGHQTGVKLPDVVRIWAVEAGDVTTFREDLTPAVQQAVPLVVAEILRDLFPDGHVPRRLAQ